MLTPEVIKKLEDFVFLKPRSIQEVAQHLKKNWRTADRYIEEIESNYGTITTRVFRGGTRGALKIVYWAGFEKMSHSAFQELLEKEILIAKRKEDFSAFDIFQHIDDRNKRAIVEQAIDENSTNLMELKELLDAAQKQLIIFSGDLSFINLKNKNFDMMQILEELVKKGISVKILCSIDFAAKENIERVLSLNYKYRKEVIEIRHKEHPVRAFIIDNKILRIKEVKSPSNKIKGLDKKTFIFYTIRDKDWAEWMSKIFWKMFSSSIGSEKRLLELNKLKIT